jgi:hypothetical protein
MPFDLRVLRRFVPALELLRFRLAIIKVHVWPIAVSRLIPSKIGKICPSPMSDMDGAGLVAGPAQTTR